MSPISSSQKTHVGRSSQAEDLGLYIHWPFCLSKCPYCDFNSHVREKIDQDRWRRSLLAELDYFAERLEMGDAPGHQLKSIFFGGGTPSLMAPETVGAVIAHAKALWPHDQNLEVTLEANPTSSEAARFAAYADAGVSRLSLGVQALDDAALKFLGREHDRADALNAIDLARRAFSRYSFDLIYARPGQDHAHWAKELDEALSLGPSHISLYQLTIEEGTAFHARRRRGELRELPVDEASELFSFTRDHLAKAGLPAYEVSNHAKVGEESRHNLLYWQSGDYIGVGPGAHGRLTFNGTRKATRQHRAPEAWLAMVERDGHATRQEEALSRGDSFSEFLMMGLRLTSGIPRDAFLRKFDQAPEDCLSATRLDTLQDEELLVLDEEGMRATEDGMARLNAVLSYLLN